MPAQRGWLHPLASCSITRKQSNSMQVRLFNVASFCFVRLKHTLTCRVSQSRHLVISPPLHRRSGATAFPSLERLPHKKIRMRAEAGQMAPAGEKAPMQHQQAQQQQQHGQKRPPPGQQKQQRKKAKKVTPEMQLRWDIHQAAKANDPIAALAVYDRGTAEGLKLDLDVQKTLLFLCSGGQNWDAKVQAPTAAGSAAPANGAPAAAAGGAEPGSNGKPSAGERGTAHAQATTSGREEGGGGQADAGQPQEPRQMSEEDWVYASKRGREIWQALDARGAAKCEVVYTALARMAATAGEPDQALQAARDALAAGHKLRLRSFVPALRAFCAVGSVDKALEVDRLIAEQGLDLTEDEFALLIGVCAAEGGAWAGAEGVLRRMSRELTQLQPPTLAAVERFFRSEAAKQGLPAGAEGPCSWLLERCTVSSDGRPSCCDGQLQAMDLSEEEYAAFAEGIATLAAARERNPSDFQQFQVFLEQHGPFTCLIDGANAAMFGQNWEDGDTGQKGGFNFAQIEAVVDQVAQECPGLKPLLVLHQSRVKPGVVGRDARARALLERLKREHAFYATPFGSNDDWYWLHAAVAGGADALVVSCDEMRDHLFQMLAPKYFRKWKQRHQVYFRFRGDGRAVLTHPAPFTQCTQRLEASGAWLFPAADSEEWLCARPA